MIERVQLAREKELHLIMLQLFFQSWVLLGLLFYFWPWCFGGGRFTPSGTSQCHNHAQLLKVNNSGGSNLAGRKTARLATVQLCEYKNQTLEAFVAASRLYAKFDCPVARQNIFYFKLLRMIVKLQAVSIPYVLLYIKESDLSLFLENPSRV